MIDSECSCQCEEGYSGFHCEFEVCSSNHCTDHGNCILNNNEPTCNCSPGWTGDFCESYDPCGVHQCLNGGNCELITPSHAVCSCPDGYYGHHCERSACHPNPCGTKGQCFLTNESFVCQCDPGFFGDNCEVSSCNDIQCNYGNEYPITDNLCVCYCNDEWTGSFCDSPIEKPFHEMGSSCSATADCIEGENLECQSGYCQCKNGYENIAGSCKPKNGIICQNSSDCSGAEICQDSVCTCYIGYTKKDGKWQCTFEEPTKDNSFCLTDNHCSGMSTCIDRQCYCFAEWISSQCSKTCNKNNDCEALKSGSICVNETCQPTNELSPWAPNDCTVDDDCTLSEICDHNNNLCFCPIELLEMRNEYVCTVECEECNNSNQDENEQPCVSSEDCKFNFKCDKSTCICNDLEKIDNSYICLRAWSTKK